MNIYEKILDIMVNVKYLSKDDTVEFKTTKYKALSEEKVTSIMRQQMIEHKLIVYPIAMKRERVNQITSVDVTYRILNVENPDEYVDVVSSGDGADTQDKGAGKAMTYAYKYMWLRTFGIPTGEDPDKVSSDELDAKQAAENAVISENEAEVLRRMYFNKTGKELNEFKKKPIEQLTAKEYTEALKMLDTMPGPMKKKTDD